MPTPPRSRRFKPSLIIEKIVPIVLAILLLTLLAVFVVIGLSLAGIFPPA